MKLSTKTVSAILERWTDEGIVTDYASEYGEPGYDFTTNNPDEGDTPCVVLGSYWCQCGKITETCDNKERVILHPHEHHRPHLWNQLAEQGVTFEWHDEWTIDYDNDKAYRTSPNSYMWMQSFVYTDDGEMLTAVDDIDAWVEWATEDPESPRVLPGNIWSKAALVEAGFTKHDHEFQSGFHKGQNDTGESALAEVKRDHGIDITVLFRHDDQGQFDATFSAWWKATETDKDKEE